MKIAFDSVEEVIFAEWEIYGQIISTDSTLAYYNIVKGGFWYQELMKTKEYFIENFGANEWFSPTFAF